MQTGVYLYIEWTWTAVGVVWLIGALASRQAVRREGLRSRILHMAIMAAAFFSFYSVRLRVGPLTWRFLPPSPLVEWAGFALTVAGCAVAVWARLLLGGNWSASVTVKRDHRLIREGPYTIVRHPIYSGFLLALLGTALALDELCGLIGLALAFTGWRMKSRLEENFMVAQFGADYVAYEREVKALIPFVL